MHEKSSIIDLLGFNVLHNVFTLNQLQKGLE